MDRGIYKQSEGVYFLVVSTGKDPATGKYKQKWERHVGSLTTARDRRRKLLGEVEEGHHKAASGTVSELFDLWLADLERLQKAPKTIRGYRADADFYWRPAVGDMIVAKVTSKDLRKVLNDMADRQLSPETIRHVRACISGAFTWAKANDWISLDPTKGKALPIPAKQATRPLVPTPQEVVALLKAAADSVRPEFARVIWLAAVTGARSSEIRALRLSDFDLENGRMGVERALSSEKVWTTKNRQIRDVSLDQQTVDVVLTQIDFMEQRHEGPLPADAYLFSDDPAGQRPWREEQITKFFSELADNTEGVRDEITFKHLRKFMSTYGRELGFTGEAVADRAGHDPAVAERHYRGKVQSERDKELSTKLAELLTP